MPPISSGIVPITKQLNRVTPVRVLPAPATTRPAGRNLKSVIAAQNRVTHPAASRSGAASAVATRRQVSSIVLSTTSPEGVLRRYFMSQICCDIEPTSAMVETSSYRPEITIVPDSFGRTFLATTEPARLLDIVDRASPAAAGKKQQGGAVSGPVSLQPPAAIPWGSVAPADRRRAFGAAPVPRG